MLSLKLWVLAVLNRRLVPSLAHLFKGSRLKMKILDRVSLPGKGKKNQYPEMKILIRSLWSGGGSIWLFYRRET